MIENLQSEFGDMYTFDNVVLSATHTHSGPGGYDQYVLFDVNTHGFVEEVFQAYVTGITEVLFCGVYALFSI